MFFWKEVCSSINNLFWIFRICLAWFQRSFSYLVFCNRINSPCIMYLKLCSIRTVTQILICYILYWNCGINRTSYSTEWTLKKKMFSHKLLQVSGKYVHKHVIILQCIIGYVTKKVGQVDPPLDKSSSDIFFHS